MNLVELMESLHCWTNDVQPVGSFTWNLDLWRPEVTSGCAELYINENSAAAEAVVYDADGTETINVEMDFEIKGEEVVFLRAKFNSKDCSFDEAVGHFEKAIEHAPPPLWTSRKNGYHTNRLY